MSGGHWNYQDQNIVDELPVRYLEKMLEGLRRCFHEVDWSESGDTSQRSAEKRLYVIVRDLGNDIWGGD